MKRTRYAALGAAALALALTMSACSGGSGGAGPSVNASQGASDQAKLPNTAWEVADYSAVKQGGSLTLPIDAMPANWNSGTVDGNTSDQIRVLLASTTGGPVRIKADGTWEANPDYATEIKLISQDPQVVEVKLNPKAVWSDGAPMTYKDMLMTWKAFNGTNKKFQVASTNVYQDISAVEKEDTDYNYKVTFKNKNADWPSVMNPFEASVMKDPATFNDAYKSKPVPANGPFMVSKVDTTGQVVTLTPNPKWWGQKPKLDTIIVKTIESQDSLAQAFANKEVDAMGIGSGIVSADVYNTAKKRDDGEIQRSGGVTWYHFDFNAAKAPLDDVKVRQGIARAINRDTIAQSRLSPLGAPVTTMDNYIYMPGQNGYTDDASSTIGYDPTKAGALLDEAGWKKGSDGVRAKDGKPLAISVTVPSGIATSADAAKQIQANLKAVGVTLTIDTVPVAKFFSDYITTTDKKNFQTTLFSWVGTAFPVSSAESIFYPADSEQNYNGVSDPALGDLWKQANAELDPAKQREIAKQIDQKIFSYVPMVPISPTPTVSAVKKGLVNLGATQFQDVDWTTVGWKS
ncbi:ABC transporter family substrate-binding protein [Paenarthrobacter sp. Z7-10]|uniref:ABC transporter family substrate-binding protein n=1 Tax=Paenarthrobacter sp. Z7-10 TaxID=2787635 RepID=UPI0022A99D1A|nr:ABC transporter family substrate-binding protein [Paenarthrobacter sp. Z7-10]MCZ2404322.1 ABC transporter family substrate-binding protein [Paenarthrobacter sp. Z7-10]